MSVYAEYLVNLAKQKRNSEVRLDKNTVLVSAPTGHSIRKIGGPKRHYVYRYLDPRGEISIPIYVGKGQGKRLHAHLEADTCKNPLLRAVIHDLRKAGTEPIVEIVDRFSDEIDALALESKLITDYGRRDLGTGTLCNLLSSGGESGGHRKRRRQRKGVSWYPNQQVDVRGKKRTMMFTPENLRSLWNGYGYHVGKWKGPEFIWDEKQPGLALRRGSTWYVKLPGRDPYPLQKADLFPDEARAKAKRDLLDARRGFDAYEERKIRKEQTYE